MEAAELRRLIVRHRHVAPMLSSLLGGTNAAVRILDGSGTVDAKLHLAIAYLLAGDNAKAQATLKTVSGNDGTADLARLWALYARRKA